MQARVAARLVARRGHDVPQRVAPGDVDAARPDDAGQFQLVVEEFGVVGPDDIGLGPVVKFFER